MSKVVDRFMKYTRVWSESDYHAGDAVPSAEREFDMAKVLLDELHALGIENAHTDSHCYTYAVIPATKGYENLPAVGFAAHVDTTPDMTGKDVKPQIIHYEGGDIVLNREKQIVMRRADFPELEKMEGRDLIMSDGTTLLGGDDKAGVAMIMQAVEEILAEKTPHGKICLCFEPDEEIGRGADYFDVKGFGADFAFTLDGGTVTDFEYETFNAAWADVTVNGFSIHPGVAKDRMKNAILIGIEYNAMLPPMETPGHTEGYEGFYHLQEIHGKAESAKMVYLIRDHSMERFKERKAQILKAAEEINRRYGAGTIEVSMHDQYYNMYEILKDHMDIVELAEQAMKKAGIENPTHSPIRGGTDGAMLTFRGLPCPNLPAAGYNAHGRYEFVPVDELETGVKIVKNVLSPELLSKVHISKEDQHNVQGKN